MLAGMTGFLARTIRAIALLGRDARIPKPLRFVAAIGLLPIPGPVDEALLLLIAPVFALFYREPLREAWREASRPAAD
jgi:hypothetical protein